MEQRINIIFIAFTRKLKVARLDFLGANRLSLSINYVTMQ